MGNDLGIKILIIKKVKKIKNINFDTLAIHGGKEGKNPEKALNYPIFMTSTFTFDSIEDAEKAFSFETEDYVYTRGNNPTLRLLEKKMAILEKGVDSVAFASGMAAITSTLFSFLKPGQELIAHKVLYGSTHNFINEILPEYGIHTKLIDLTRPENFEKEITGKTRAVYFETPANPSLDIIDIKKISDIANNKGIKVIVDNTFATPYFQRPLELGADVVVHSTTKYINGHGDTLGGIAIANNEEYIQKLKFGYMAEFGGVLSPFNAWLIVRGLKTLALRMRQHESTATKVAKYLEKHPEVKKVYYPGLKSFEAYEIAKKQMDGYGAIIGFELNGSVERSIAFINSLKLIKLAVSLGDTETLIEYPFAMTHRSYTEKELLKFGLTKKMIRLSIGLEDYQDIISDLEQALA